MPEDRLVVGVVPRERWSLSVPSLHSLLETLPEGVPLIYVDGGAPEAIAAELQQLVEAAGGRYFRFDFVLSCQEARNLITAEAGDVEYVVFVENDVALRPGWLEALVTCADETGAGAVQPLVFMGETDDTELIHIGYGRIEINDGVLDVNYHEHEWDAASEVPEQTRRRTWQMEFHTFLARKAMLDEIGPFDERIRSIGDHEDLVLLADRAGWELYYEPASQVVFRQFVKLTPEDRGFWQLHWSEQWIQPSLDHFAEKWNIHPNEGWLDLARRWSSQRRTWWYHGQGPLVSTVGKVWRRILVNRRTPEAVRNLEYRLFARPAQAEHDRRVAAINASPEYGFQP